MKLDLNNEEYKKHLKEEQELWDKVARDELKSHPPDYAYYKNTLPYKIYRNKFFKPMLEYIKPGDRVLELGCYNGWVSLELARKGAIVDSHDIAEGAIRIAQEYYKKAKKKEKFSGTITFHVTDLNDAHFPKNTYDVIMIRNVLHHIANLKPLFNELDKALKKNGFVVADDALPCGKKEAFVVGILLMLLPSDIPYRHKFQRVFRKRNIIKRTQGLVDAKDASPFEGISGNEGVYYLRRYFDTKYYTEFTAFIGAIAPQLRFPQVIKIPFLKTLNLFDLLATRTHLLRGAAYLIIARKKI